VAAFELGRLAKEQGRLVTAKRALKQVLKTDERDVLGEEARFELCQLLTREGSNDESVECWQALQDASDPSLRDKANQALNER
jgi:predicted negative regulator of RcsB-dependent stress response